MAHRSFDDITNDTEHVRPVHPLRALIDRHWYLDGFIEKGGMSLVLMDGLILVPIIMFAFFYPKQVLMWVGGVLLVALVVYESVMIWRKRHPQRT